MLLKFLGMAIAVFCASFGILCIMLRFRCGPAWPCTVATEVTFISFGLLHIALATIIGLMLGLSFLREER